MPPGKPPVLVVASPVDRKIGVMRQEIERMQGDIDQHLGDLLLTLLDGIDVAFRMEQARMEQAWGLSPEEMEAALRDNTAKLWRSCGGPERMVEIGPIEPLSADVVVPRTWEG